MHKWRINRYILCLEKNIITLYAAYIMCEHKLFNTKYKICHSGDLISHSFCAMYIVNDCVLSASILYENNLYCIVQIYTALCIFFL